MHRYACDSSVVKQIDTTERAHTFLSSDLDGPMLQRSRKAEGRDDRREALLAIAAQEFNAYGIAGASLARIARNWGATRPALYYYVRDREELAALCYGRTCEVMAADLASAESCKGSGLAKVLAFIASALDPAREPSAVLSELACLEGKAHGRIAASHDANVERLRALIRAGIADGSIRRCDDEIAAQVVIGILFWIPVSADWVAGTESSYRERTVRALLELIEIGQSADPDFVLEPSVEIEAFFSAPGSAFDRKAVVAAKTEELMMTASRLFNQRGIDGTSLDDVAEVLGATKGTLYHYFRDKGDLVVKCTRRAFSLYERFVEACEAQPGNQLSRGLLGLYLNVQAHTSGLSPLVQLAGVEALPTVVRREITQRARRIQQYFDKNARDGLGAGAYRDIDFYTAAQIGAGSFQWLPKWLKDGDPRRKHAIADEIVTIFVRGLRAH